MGDEPTQNLARLTSDDPHTRWDAALKLGELGTQSAVEPLIAQLVDHHFMARLGAAQSLTKLGWQPTSPEQRYQHLVAQRDWETLAESGANAAPHLIKVLGDSEYDIQRKARWALVRIGSDAVFALCNALPVEDPNVRVELARALGEIRDPSAAATLEAALGDTEHMVRRACAIALGLLKHLDAAAKLVPLLDDSHHAAQEAAVWALGQLGNNAVQQLLRAAEQKTLRNHAAAVQALVLVGPAAQQLLQEAAASAGGIPAKLARQALDRLADLPDLEQPWID